MDLGFDLDDWRQAPAASLPAGGWCHAPDWPVLQARLAAAWSARREFALNAAGVTPKIGSFARGVALTLSGSGYASRGINQSDSAIRKPDEGNSVRLAGSSISGS